MAKTGEKRLKIPGKHLRLVGTRGALTVFFQNAEIVLASEIQGIGREFFQAVEVAVRVDMPLVVNFQGVKQVSSALIGKLVLLNKKARSEGVKLEFRDIPPAIRKVMRIPPFRERD